jgi:hypothetical protein
MEMEVSDVNKERFRNPVEVIFAVDHMLIDRRCSAVRYKIELSVINKGMPRCVK